MENKVFNETKVITGKVRFSYAKVFTPEQIEGSDEAKYSVSLIIPKSDKETISKILKAIDVAKNNGLTTKFQGKIPAGPNFKTPLRDGDLERPDDDAYKDSFFVNASCKTKPGVINKYGAPIDDPEEFYSGCYGKASVTFYPFNSNGNKGIAAGLNNLLKLEEGEHLGGRMAAEDDFASEIEVASLEDDGI